MSSIPKRPKAGDHSGEEWDGALAEYYKAVAKRAVEALREIMDRCEISVGGELSGVEDMANKALREIDDSGWQP